MRITSFNKCTAIHWSFARDGGAVGSIAQNIIIPAGAMLWYMCYRVISTINGGAGATISIGTNSNPIFTTLVFGAGQAPTSNLITAGIPFTGEELKVIIAVNPMTSGEFFSYIGWFEGKMP